MIWLGGGYPELHAAGLSANQEALAAGDLQGGAQIHQAAALGVDRHPAPVRRAELRTRFGYCEAQAQQQTLLAAPGEWLRGHEFHYSDFTPASHSVLLAACSQWLSMVGRWAKWTWR
jgi:cobyrinic acid a,c-diamide synthase